MLLEAELKTYYAHLDELLVDEGRYVLIRGETILDTYDTYRDAIQVGYDKCRLDPFLVKKIQAVDQVHLFTRDIVPA